MPIPKTRDVGKIMRFLKREDGRWGAKQKIAIALSTARKAGANIPKKPGNPIGEEVARRAGRPRTEAERRKRHKARFGTTKLPPRGRGQGLA